MRERKRFLPPGWYPSGAEGVTDAIKAMARSFTRRPPEHGIAGVIPHAGWEFSGGLAFEVMSCLSRSIDTIVIIGGHLGPSDGILCAMEDTFQTPLGSLHADGWLRDTVSRPLALQEDSCADNSVEIQLPFAKYLFPDAGMLWLRAAPSEEAVKLGVALAAAGREGGRCLAIVGSTDLTHYGPNYGF
ncbi:MAG TPA: AmmeMemoRadiSam system protein B, partial [Spirochaetia bacterium]|nr:AmmeMemoRadiSam system protein B [Spirochaetia bacterium]